MAHFFLGVIISMDNWVWVIMMIKIPRNAFLMNTFKIKPSNPYIQADGIP
jgi:hypothetical protein